MTYLLVAIVLVLAVPPFMNFFMPEPLVRLYFGMRRRRGRVSQKWVTVGDIRWPYLEGGPKDGDILVMVHGFGGNKDNWAAYARHFTESYRVIAPDLPGFGDNSKDLSLAFDIKAQTKRLIEFLDAMKIEKCHLSGNSMGGFITLQCALMAAEKLHSISLFTNAGVEATRKSALELSIDAGENLFEVNTIEDVTRVYSLIFHEELYLPLAFKKVQYAQAKSNRAILDKIFQALVAELPDSYLDSQLKNVTVPTLIIWGRHDQIIDISCAEKMQRDIPQSELVIFEDCGHIPMLEKPKASAKNQLRFIKSL